MKKKMKKRRFGVFLVVTAMIILLFPSTAFATQIGEELPYTAYCEKCGYYVTPTLKGYSEPYYGIYNYLRHNAYATCPNGHDMTLPHACFEPDDGEYVVACSQLSSSSSENPDKYHMRTCVCGRTDYQEHNYSAWTSSTRTCSDCGYVQTCDHDANTTILCYGDGPCSVCGTTLEKTEHSLRSSFTCDEKNERHWRECRYCEDKIDEGVHIDTDNNHRCDICHSIFTSCVDSDNDHLCDTCSSILSEHKLTHFEKKEATTSEEGNEEYYYCSVCQKYFKDANGTEKYDNGLDDVVISKLPVIIKGGGQKVTVGTKEALAFTSDADFAKFCNSVLIDGKELDAANYTAADGSTIITLNADYVAALPVGEHTIGVVSENGTATATFIVEEAKVIDTEEKAKDSAAKAKDSSAETGDDSNMYLWIALLLASGCAAAAVTVKRRKHSS